MSENNNIENFDSFFKEAFEKFEPEAPQGVWEGIQSQIGAQGAGVSGAGTLAKTAQWGLGKIILGAATIVAVATAVYFAASPAGENAGAGSTTGNTPAVQEQTAARQPEATNSSTGISNQPGETQPDGTVENFVAENTAAPSIQPSRQANAPGNSKPGNATPATQGTPESNNTGTAGTPGAAPNNSRPAIENTQKNTVTVPLYVSDSKACLKDKITCTIADDLSKTTYRVDFGDGTYYTTKPGQPITHAYKKPGSYKVTASEVNGSKTTKEQWVSVLQVKAAFTAENTDKATFKFTNSSEGGLYYTWFFGDDSEAAKETSPVHTFKNFEETEHKVKLVAMNEIGCIDSFTTKVKQVYTYDDIKPVIPNVFSPNGDGYNERFEIGIANEEKYHLTIFDRSGNKVFESSSKDITWDGKNIYSGEECPATTYVMVFVYKIKGFSEHKVQETITIKR